MLSIFESQSEKICENGVEIKLEIHNSIPVDGFVSESSKENVKNMFAGAKVHHVLYNLKELADNASKEFDQDIVANIFKKLFELDQQSYYDMMVILSSVIAALDFKHYALFSNTISDMVTNEINNQPVKSSESAEIGYEENVDKYDEENIPEDENPSDMESKNEENVTKEEENIPEENDDLICVDATSNDTKSKKKES